LADWARDILGNRKGRHNSGKYFILRLSDGRKTMGSNLIGEVLTFLNRNEALSDGISVAKGKGLL
jgi:hypothetical protein